ncbi:MAG TPA: tetratricopeptide repeat protein [Isosphaeraceae bacterium]|nr:tetratricopeptide repeat protein [Isosphaeraceae bacterium]
MIRADGLIVVLLASIAFLLGCAMLFDTDIWWHVRSGEWILEHRRVPWLDPFTFTSSDRVWIDLHWGFQVAIALAHRLGGVRGILILASVACTSTFLLALGMRREGWSVVIAGWCWVPALALLSSRFDPRPEIFSLLLLAAFLVVLSRAEQAPRLLWLLPLLQVAWVNVHALFVLGPVIVACYLTDRLVRGFLETVEGPTGWAWWRHAWPATLAVLLGCWLNPYGLQGVLFPGEIFGKISSPSNPYKQYVAEFMSLSSMVQKQGLPDAAANLYLRATTFLLLLLPWSFVVPSAWKCCRPELRTDSGYWTRAFLGGVAVAMIGTLGLPARDMPPWMALVGRFSSLLCLFLAAAMLVIGPRSRQSILVLISGALAIAGWYEYLRGHLYGFDQTLAEPWRPSLRPMLGLVGLIAAFAAIGEGARPFLILLTIAFGVLGLLAYRNMNLFGLVAGVVLAWNLGEWSCAICETARPWRRLWSRAAAAALVALLLAWLYAIPTDRFYSMTGELRHFGVKERPFWYAHDAARFAGGPGMPDRALVFDVGQTGVYLYHNGPDRKLFMDSRLEIPSLETFRTYISLEQWLQRGDGRWTEAVRRMGDPLILIAHEENADAVATLLADRGWRCVWFDPVAAVFLPDHDSQLKSVYPSVDFAARYFDWPSVGKIDPVASLVEAKAFSEIGGQMARRPGVNLAARLPLLLLGMRHARVLLESGQESPQAWTILGHCTWSLAPDLHNGPPDRLAAWDLATGLSWAQAAFCYRQALKQSSHNAPALLSLARLFEIRRMAQAQAAVAASVRAITNRQVTGGVQSLDELTRALDATGVNLTWDEAEKRAVALLNLGAPVEARQLYERAIDPPSSALRHCRIADACLAAFLLQDSERAYRASMAEDGAAGQSWFGLYLTMLVQGRPSEALQAYRAALRCTLSTPQRSTLERLEPLLARYSERTHQAGRSGRVTRAAGAAGSGLDGVAVPSWRKGKPPDR